MPRPSHRFIALVSMLAAILVAMALLYMLGMEYLEGKPRTFWQSLQWAGGATSTTGFGVDTSWTHPVMVVFVVFAEFMGVALFFVVLPIYLLPFLEERFETKLPNESASARNHVVIFDYDATVATVVRKYSIRLMRARANRVMQAARGQLARPSQTEWRCATLLSALGHG